MNERRARWNDRYSRGEETHDFAPSSPLPAAVDELLRSRGHGLHPATSGLPGSPGLGPSIECLDVACGAGRHALYLAERGLHVVAVDWSENALSLLSDEAARRGLSDRVAIKTADIEAGEYIPSPNSFDLVCDFYFLSRPLLPSLLDAVKPGGLFVAAIHVESAESAAPHRFLLAPGELQRAVASRSFDVLHASEAVHREGAAATAEIIARRA